MGSMANQLLPPLILGLSFALFFLNPTSAEKGLAGSTSPSLAFPDLPLCNQTSLELTQLSSDVLVDPCILYDVRSDAEMTDKTPEVTIVHLTPYSCPDHRDGAVTAVEKLNGDNKGKGYAIGFNKDHYLRFRLVSVIGGNPNSIGTSLYSDQHVAVLDSMLETLKPQYIMGTCTSVSSLEKALALKHKTVLMAQVGPPGFYKDNNPYVFGIHVNSDTYPLPALQSLRFYINGERKSIAKQPVRVIYRTKSEFFYSTCRSVIDKAILDGFDTTAIEYDPEGDEDDNGVLNKDDVAFLEGMADQACPSGPVDGSEDAQHPALFACVTAGVEAGTILARWRANGCRPGVTWFTTATWGWAESNKDTIPFFQGGGQWHKNFAYSDQYFDSGQDVLDYGVSAYGYHGNYDHVVSYAIPLLFSQHIKSFFRIQNTPDVVGAFENNYEEMRRALLVLRTETIFGPVSFNEDQRNAGRGAAGMQWIPSSSSEKHIQLFENELSEAGDYDDPFILGCVSPYDQAEAATIVPAASALDCSPGMFTSIEKVQNETALLESKCDTCPLDTFSMSNSRNLQCMTCPAGSTTEGEIGSTYCVQMELNLLSPGVLVMGYIFVALSWCFSLGYFVWIYRNKEHPVVSMGQIEFLTLFCLGTFISSSSIIALGGEALVSEDNTMASRSCQAIPFLYSCGWVLMYSSLTAKSYRLFKVLQNSRDRIKRVEVRAKDMYYIVAVPILLVLVILVAWQLTDPIVYERRELSRDLNPITGVLTISSVGLCTNVQWKFLGPLIAVHVLLAVVTNIILWKVRDVRDRYQEQRVVAMASIYICELLLLGVPILFAVRDSSDARYIVLAGVVFLTDTGSLSLVFIPKIMYQRERAGSLTIFRKRRQMNFTSVPRKNMNPSERSVVTLEIAPPEKNLSVIEEVSNEIEKG